MADLVKEAIEPHIKHADLIKDPQEMIKAYLLVKLSSIPGISLNTIIETMQKAKLLSSHLPPRKRTLYEFLFNIHHPQIETSEQQKNYSAMAGKARINFVVLLFLLILIGICVLGYNAYKSYNDNPYSPIVTYTAPPPIQATRPPSTPTPASPTPTPLPTPPPVRITTAGSALPQDVRALRSIQFLRAKDGTSISKLIEERGGIELTTIQSLRSCCSQHVNRILTEYNTKGKLVILTIPGNGIPVRIKNNKPMYPEFIIEFRGHSQVVVKVPPPEANSNSIDRTQIVIFSQFPPSEEEQKIAAAILNKLGLVSSMSINSATIGKLTDPLGQSEDPNHKHTLVREDGANIYDFVWYLGDKGVSIQTARRMSREIADVIYYLKEDRR